MNESNESQKTGSPRKVWVAIVLSLLLPGLGQTYCGKLLRGLAYLGAGSLLMLLVLFGTGIAPGKSPALFGLYLTAQTVLMVVAAVDARRLARAAETDFRLMACNQWWVYVVLLLIGSGVGSVQTALEIRRSYVEAFVLPTRSMSPTFVPGDRVLVAKSAYVERDPERGELVVFLEPGNRKRHYVKRVVGVAGDRVSISEGVLSVNGEPVGATPGGDGTAAESLGDGGDYRVDWGTGGDGENEAELDEVVVPPYSVYVLGDHRAKSRDSRHFGAIPIVGIKGRVSSVYFPGDWDFGRIGVPAGGNP